MSRRNFLYLCFSGLDSTSSLAVVKALNTIASKGNLTVMCVIHQPRFEILSKLFIIIVTKINSKLRSPPPVACCLTICSYIVKNY